MRSGRQVFFRFGDRQPEDYTTFAASRDVFAAMGGWEYRLWDEATTASFASAVLLFSMSIAFGTTRRCCQVRDSCFGGAVCDFGVFPQRHLDGIVSSLCLFDLCSRRNVVANDDLYTERGLPGIFDDFAANLARGIAIPVYACWKMRYVFQSTGPNFFTRLNRTGLARYGPSAFLLLPRPRAEALRGALSRSQAGDRAPPRLEVRDADPHRQQSRQR